MEHDLKTAIQALVPNLAGIRHALHAHPELSGDEAWTAAFVADQLAGIGLDSVRAGVGGHGIVAEIRGASVGRTVALRADMDALPIVEQTGASYCSTIPGAMHACGHDGHTTMLLGAATLLAAHRELLHGSVRLLFQPAEESVKGAEAMCAEGAMDGVDSVFALHGWPDLPVGSVGVRTGPMMASVDDFDIEIAGSGGHTGYPHLATDPIVVGARIVEAVQSLLTRETDPFDPVVLAITRFDAGANYNVIPSVARLSGTIRTHAPATRERLRRRLAEVAVTLAQAASASATLTFVGGSPPVSNDPAATDLVARVGRETLGENAVVWLDKPSMGGEDFAVYLGYAPGAFFRLGLGDVTGLHTPTFDFPDAALAAGVEMLSRVAIEALR
ncbi:MAG: M20 family metallopeptidase [Capsulimonadaceae bacterium]|nr:M20 family metallopeptidase [Capsulimonadaceae bacterium]